jgi:hypothetical protein
MNRVTKRLTIRVFTILIFVSLATRSVAQEPEFAIHFDPIISWMASNSHEYTSEGARAGFSLGLDVLHYFSDNFAVSTGIGFINAGGRQSAVESHTMIFNNFTRVVSPGEEMRYGLNYLNIPIGLRIQTDPRGDLTYFTDMGLDLRILLKSVVDIPSLDIASENAKNEVYGINAGWHISAGIEYKLGIHASIYTGLGLDADFFDVTKDLEDVFQPDDKSALRMIKIRMGIRF